MAEESTTNFSEESQTSTFFAVDIPKKKSKKRKCLKISCVLIWLFVLVLAVGVSLWFWVIPYVIQEETPEAGMVEKLVGENKTNCVYTGKFARDRKGQIIF